MSPDHPRFEPMASVNAAWLHMENPTNLMVVTGMMLFDETLEFQRLKTTLEQRMLRFDRFRQHVVEPELSLGGPHWETDPNFDINAHIHRLALPAPGDQAALQDSERWRVDAMPTITHYVCQRELLPMVEGALAAHGYRIEIPRQRSAGRTTALVMTRGLTTFLLSDSPDQALAEIEIWGMGQSLAAQLIESLPIKLHRPSSIALTALRGADTAAYVG